MRSPLLVAACAHSPIKAAIAFFAMKCRFVQLPRLFLCSIAPQHRDVFLQIAETPSEDAPSAGGDAEPSTSNHVLENGEVPVDENLFTEDLDDLEAELENLDV